MNINIIVGQMIKQERKKKNWTQEDLANKTLLHRAYIGQIERAEKNIGLQNLEHILNSLNLKLSDLFKKYEEILSKK